MKIYCCGIGGIGLSAYASLQKAAGHIVSGSDSVDSEILDDLKSQGISVYLQQDGSHVSKDIDLFVYSEAIPPDSDERKKAFILGLNQKNYAQALGDLSRDFRVIAVAGTHGKSSTVAMAAKVLSECGCDTTVLAGTKIREFNNRNWRLGKSDLFLLEACEYMNSFHNYSPNIILITNADGDHFDFFKNVKDYQKSFSEFVKKLPVDGTLITHLSDPVCSEIAKNSKRSFIDADEYDLPKLSTPGIHMQQNAQLVVALSDVLGLNRKSVLQSLKLYAGCWRRIEKKGFFNLTIPVIDDYGHHPKEIAATLKAVKEDYPDKRLVCVFQPHMHHRTLALYDAFLPAFSSADKVIFADVYDARSFIERNMVDMQKFAKDVAIGSNVLCTAGGSLQQIESDLRGGELHNGDLLLCMGAGTITELACKMVSKIGNI